MVLALEGLIVEAVEDEVQKLRLDSLSALALQKLNQMVVCGGRVLDQNLTDNSDLRFFHVLMDRQGIKLLDNPFA